MLGKVKQFLDDLLPSARYTDGTESHCIFYRVCNVFDISDD